MKQAFKEFSPFQVNPDKVWADYNINASDFEPATESEKESMVEIRKSVSYWRDAARRFKNNTVSMVALGIFIIVLLFAFLGPSLIPYDYANQYRSSQKLGPFEYSDQEAKIKSIEDHKAFGYLIVEVIFTVKGSTVYECFIIDKRHCSKGCCCFGTILKILF